MNALALAVFILFACTAVFHLVCCFRQYGKNGTVIQSKFMADSSKPMLMPLLALSAAFLLLDSTAPASSTLLLSLSLIFGTIGDIFLINDRKTQNFNLGTTSFFIGHIFYLCLYLPSSFSFKWWIFIPVIAAALAFSIISWFTINKPSGLTGILCIMYGIMLVILLFSGISMLIKHKAGAVSVASGAVAFMVSDSILSRTIFVKDFKYSRFAVMVTYIAAQVLLVLGTVLQYMK